MCDTRNCEKRKLYRILSLAALLGWMVVIYAFSAQDNEESGALSDGIVDKVIVFFYPDYEKVDTEEQLRRHELISFVVRKTAHATEYGILAVLAWVTATQWFAWERRWYYAGAFGLAVLYAVTDEFHQTFVSGRVGSPRDVVIDSGGALLGLVLLWGISRLANNIMKKSQGNSSSSHM